MLLRLLKFLIGWEPCRHQYEKVANVFEDGDYTLPIHIKYRCVHCCKVKKV